MENIILWGGVESVWHQFLVRSLKLSTLVHSQYLDRCLDWCSRVIFPYFTQTCGFKNIWSRHIVKQLWPPDRCRRTEGRLTAKGCVISTQQERSFKWIDPSEWWWREERWTSMESLWLPAIGYWAGIQSGLTNDWEQWVWCFLSVRHPGLIPVYSCTLLFSGLRSH